MRKALKAENPGVRDPAGGLKLSEFRGSALAHQLGSQAESLKDGILVS